MKVLLTRRTADNARMAALFATAGLEAVSLPLIELEDTGRVLPDRRYDFSVFTSAAAIEVLSSRKEGCLHDMPAYAVGPRTAEMLTQEAYLDVRQGPGDAEGLASLIASDFGGKEAVCGIYPCCEARARDLAGMLEPAGITLDLAEIYRFTECGVSRDEMAAALGSTKGGAAAVFSAESGKRLVAQARRLGLESAFETISAAVLSQGVADTLDADLFRDVRVAAHPDAGSMVELLVDIRQERRP